MTQAIPPVKKSLLLNGLSWFQGNFRQSIVSLLESLFPNYPLPSDVQSVLDCWERIRQLVEAVTSESVDIAQLFENQSVGAPAHLPLLKQLILRYRRSRAAYTEGLRCFASVESGRTLRSG